MLLSCKAVCGGANEAARITIGHRGRGCLPLPFVQKIPFKVVKKTVEKMKRKNYFLNKNRKDHV